jgi:Protein of unknown function (DUF2818)
MSLVPTWAICLLIGLALVAANLPFMNNRLLLLGPKRSPKPTYWHLLELVLYAALVWWAGRALETHLGQAAPLRWEFFAAWGCAFLTLAFPGFVWRFLRRGAR